MIEGMRLSIITTATGVTIDAYRKIKHGAEEYVSTAHGVNFKDAFFNLAEVIS